MRKVLFAAVLAITLICSFTGSMQAQTADQYFGWNLVPGCIPNPNQVGLCVTHLGEFKLLIPTLNGGQAMDPINLGAANFKLKFDSVLMLPTGSAPTLVNIGSASDQHLVLSLPAAKDGTNGTNGTNGLNGTNGTNGLNGKDASQMTSCNVFRIVSVNTDGSWKVATSGCQ